MSNDNYQKLDTGESWLQMKVDLSKLKDVSGSCNISYSIMGGKAYFTSASITIDRPWYYLDDGMKVQPKKEKPIELHRGYYP